LKCLVVEDSRFSQTMISEYLSQTIDHLEILFALNGEEGLKGYMEWGPDFVIIDLLMPIMNGKDLVRKIREVDGSSKIFVVSSDIQLGVKREMYDLGILKYFDKPFDMDKAIIIKDILKGD
jgi:two-component system, chemotaxis family, chemotaxis protein CheY